MRISFDGIIGDKFIDIIPHPTSVTSLEKGDVLVGYHTAGITDFLSEGTKNLEESKVILEKFKEFVSDPKFFNTIDSILLNINSTTHQLNSELLPSLRKMSDSLNNISSSLEPMLADKTLHEDIRVMIHSLRESSEDLNALLSNLNEISSSPTVNNDIRSIITNTKELTEKLNKMLNGEEENSESKKKRTKIKSTINRIKRLSRIHLDGEANLYVSNVESRGGAEIQMHVYDGKFHYRAGLNNYNTESNISQFSAGYRTKYGTPRIGIINENIGVGYDVYIADNMIQGATEFYNVSDETMTDILLKLRFSDHIGFYSRAKRLNDENNKEYLYGITIN
ncbi:MlaD family protein [Candidatus Margulisiibacteriota bacterium]